MIDIEKLAMRPMTASFEPPRVRLMGPGPSQVSERVRGAMARPTIGHLDPDFCRLMDDISARLRQVMLTKNALTFALSAPGSGGMETVLVNILEPGDTAIVCINGIFGGRIKEIVQRCGANAVVVEDRWGDPVSPEKVEEALKRTPHAKLVAFVHAETSTGAMSDAKKICEIARNYEALTVVDTVTSLGGIPLELDKWGIDATYSGTQKCLSCPPGLSPISFSSRAVDCIAARKTKVQSWFFDLSLVREYWLGSGVRAYHHTAPVNAMYGLHEALLAVQEEGLENAWARHSTISASLQQGLAELGCEFVVEKTSRLPQLVSILVPDFIGNEAQARQLLRREKLLEIGAGLGPFAGKVWRIGLMGESATAENVDACLEALAWLKAQMGMTTV